MFEHSRNVTQVLITLTHDNGLAWQRPESPYIIGMFHDLCKMDLYRHPMSDAVLHAWDANGQKDIREVDTTKWEHNPDTLLKGHGAKSDRENGMTIQEPSISMIPSFGRTTQT